MIWVLSYCDMSDKIISINSQCDLNNLSSVVLSELFRSKCQSIIYVCTIQRQPNLVVSAAVAVLLAKEKVATLRRT